jgi:hypothetical protein
MVVPTKNKIRAGPLVEHIMAHDSSVLAAPSLREV